MMFAFASYSPVAADGQLSISNLQFKKVESSNYTFDYADGSLTLQDKKNVKVMALNLSIKENGEAGTVSVVIPIPSNGLTD